MTDLLVPLRLAVAVEHTLVVLAIGNTPLAMEYDVALQLSTWLRLTAKEAKRAAGDGRRERVAIGNLTALEAAPARPVLHLRRKDLVDPQRINVYRDGVRVALQYGHDVLTVDYECAIQLSTWLRVRGKEAKGHAGDARHWSDVGNLAAVEHGERPFRH